MVPTTLRNSRPQLRVDHLEPLLRERYARRDARHGGSRALACGFAGCHRTSNSSSDANATSVDAGPCPSSDCGSDCCGPDGFCAFNGIGGTCEQLCVTGSDCSSGCCAPIYDSGEANNPIGPYICQNNNVCCNEGGHCYDTCCVIDSHNNAFCAPPCKDQSACGSDATCQTYDFSESGCATGFTMACGPS